MLGPHSKQVEGYVAAPWSAAARERAPHLHVRREALAETIRLLITYTAGVLVAIAIFSPRREAALALCAFLLSFEVLSMWTLRAGHRQLSKNLLLLAFAIPTIIVVIFDGLILSGSMSALLGLVVMSAWLLGRRASLIGTFLLVTFIVVSCGLLLAGIKVPKYFIDAPIPTALFQILVLILTIVPLSNFLADLRTANNHFKLTLSAAGAQGWSTKVPQSATREQIFNSPIYIRDFPGAPTVATVGETLAQIHPSDYDEAAEKFVSSFISREEFSWEYRVLSMTGETHWMKSWGKPFQEPDGVRFLGFTLDVTERRKAEMERAALERKLLQAEKMDALAQLVRGVTHELGNNLCVIMLQAGDMANGMADPELRRRLETIVSTAQEGATISQRLSAFSKQSKESARPMHMKQALVNLKTVLLHLVRPGMDVRFDFQSERAVVMAPLHLMQIVTNLVTNAQDATSGNGTVTIALRDANRPLPGSDIPQQLVELSVEDHGNGIDDELRDRIFEPFFTTKSDGKSTGLGLSEVYGLVQQASGWIEVESERDKGSLFKVFLPACALPKTARASE
jgi:signal transduction histidine kinase